MFDWLTKRNPIVDPLNVTEPVKTIATPLPPVLQDEIVYQIGVTESGKITLRIGDGYSIGTLRMSDAGVCKLIEMLTAALDDAAAADETSETEGSND
jgi:hypothetical protein